MKKFVNLFLILFLALFCCFAIVPTVFAEEGIKASPLRIEGLVEPGQTLVKFVKVTNVSNTPKIFYAYLMDFKARGESGEPLLIPAGSEEGPYLSSWVDVPSQGIEFAPGEEKQVLLTFRVPEDAGPGGYYGAVIFGPKAPQVDPEEGAVLALTNHVGILALFHVLGDVDESARIREFATNKMFYGNPFRVSFLTRVESLGNVHIKPVGSIEIKNMLGRQVDILQVNSAGSNVLPGSTRRFENSWQDNLGFGRYTAFLVLSFGTPADQGGMGIQTVSSQTSFWIIPWKIVVPIFLGLIFLAALLALFLKVYKSKAIKKALQDAGVGKVRYVKKYKGPSPLIYLGLIITLILILIFLVVGIIFLLFFI